MKLNNLSKLIVSVFVAELTGVIGSIFTTSSIATWYAYINKPSFNPPNWLFAPVWTVLFLLMGIAAYLVWQKGFLKKGVRPALDVFVFQLVLNIYWSVIFFSLQKPAAAFAEIVFLWVAILATIIAFAKISKPAAWLLVPYILWVSFAAYLNYSIWLLN
jgi:translocator protein